MGDFSSQEEVGIHVEMSGQLLNPLLGSGEALREEAPLPLDGIPKDGEYPFWLSGADLDFRHRILLSLVTLRLFLLWSQGLLKG